MRPIRIEFQAFGSYPGKETVDLEALARRGLFVVSGNTGSGKTTIFDAMAYAAYGKFPGSRSGNKEIRSHHAEIGDHTYAEFEFESDGCRYVARRSPRYERPWKRGSGTTTEDATARLDRINDDGTTTNLATGIYECNRICSDLIGLGPEQFQRVMLLPQGQVAQFLLAKSSGREALLGHLFGGEVYGRITEELKARAARLSQEYEAATSRQRHHLEDADHAIGDLYEALGMVLPQPDEKARLGVGPAAAGSGRDDSGRTADVRDVNAIRELLLRSDETLSRTKIDLDGKNRARSRAAQEWERLKGEAARFDLADTYRKQLAQLTGQTDEIKQLVKALEVSARARPVVAADAARSAAEKSRDRTTRAKNERLALIRDGYANLGLTLDGGESVADITATLTDQRNQTERSRALLAAVYDKQATTARCEKELKLVGAELEHLRPQSARLHDTKTSIEGEIEKVRVSAEGLETASDVVEKLDEAVRLRKRLVDLDAERAAVEEQYVQARATEASAMEAFVATQAPRLAEQLADGEPCPVCGSLDHPQPAPSANERKPVTHREVRRRRRQLAEVSERLAKTAGDIAEVTGALGERAVASVVELEEELAEAQADVVIIQTFRTQLENSRKELKRIEGDAKSLDDAIRVLEKDLSVWQALLAESKKSLSEAVEAASGLDADQVAAAEAAVKRLGELVDGLDGVFDAASRSATEYRLSQTAADEALAESGLDTYRQAQAGLLEMAEERAGRQRVSRWEADCQDIGIRLQTLEKQGVPEKRPDLDQARRAAAEAAEEAEAAGQVYSRALAAIRRVNYQLGEYQRKSSDVADLKRARDRMRHVTAVCNGKGPKRITLRRWVLARELDRVTAAANVHLGRMTGYRYTIRRASHPRDKRSAAGLDIEVMDAHTGRTRPTNSLSGGEQFQASLSLALGLADVVSHGGVASGRSFDALFIDEGFGSLDADALEVAIDALQQLNESGKAVGVITHVEAVKQQLHRGIEVRLRPNGTGSTLTVNP